MKNEEILRHYDSFMDSIPDEKIDSNEVSVRRFKSLLFLSFALTEIGLRVPEPMSYYILDGKIPKKCDSIIEWAIWFETHDRSLSKTVYEDTIVVSTSFLGIDHNFFGGVPLLFETMIFGIENDSYETRCSTYEEAMEMHRKAETHVQEFLIKRQQ